MDINEAIDKVISAKALGYKWANTVNIWLSEQNWNLSQYTKEHYDYEGIPDIVKVITSEVRKLHHTNIIYTNIYEMRQAVYIRSLEERIEKLEGKSETVEQQYHVCPGVEGNTGITITESANEGFWVMIDASCICENHPSITYIDYCPFCGEELS